MHSRPFLAPLRTLVAALALAASAPAQLAWTELQPANAPPARFGQSMALAIPSYEPVLFGGTDGVASFGDTWSWTGSSWALRASSGPSPRHGHALNRLDYHDDSLLLFGGTDANGALSGETWVWGGTSWSALATSVAPSARTGHALAVDEMAERTLMLFGGRTAAGLNAETWLFVDDHWSLVTTQHQPPAREGHALIWSAYIGGFLLQGGRDESGVLADEWHFDGTDWHPRPAANATPRADHPLIFESLFRYRYLTFGSLAGAPSADTLERTVQDKWLPHQTLGAPSARTHASLGLSFHPTMASYVLFGGRDATGAALGDTWLMQPTTTPTVEEFGTGCGPGPWGPGGPVVFGPFSPLIGNSVEGTVMASTPNPFVLLVIGDEHPAPPIGTCGLLVLRKRVRVLPVSGGGSGLWFYQFGLDIPFDVNLIGSTLCLQAIARDPSGPSLSFSRGVRLTLAE